MKETDDVTFWFRYFTKRKITKLKNKLSQLHPVDIKRIIERSFKNYVLYDILRECERALEIYMLSDDSLKIDLNKLSMYLQNKNIEIAVVSIDYYLAKKRERVISTALMWLGVP